MVQNNWAGNNITTQRIFANNYVQFWGQASDYEINMPEEVKVALAKQEAHPEADLNLVNYADYTCESGDRTTDLLKPMSLRFGVDEKGELTLGFRTNGVDRDGNNRDAGAVSGAGWFKVDNFRLFYETTDIPSSISGVDSQASEFVARQYFTTDGARIAAPTRGITIVKNIMSDGTVKTTKILR